MPPFRCGSAMMPARAHPVPSPGTSRPLFDGGMGRPSATRGTARTVQGSRDSVEFYECSFPPIPVHSTHALGGMPGPAGGEGANLLSQF